MANLFKYFDEALPQLFTNESVLKNIFKRGYEEIRELSNKTSTPQNDWALGFKWIKKNRTKYCVVIYS
jgi:hypothetical protein